MAERIVGRPESQNAWIQAFIQRFMDYFARSETVQKKSRETQRFLHITSQDVATLSPENVPYQRLISLVSETSPSRENLSILYQLLEEMDPENTPLAEFRSAEIDVLLQHLKTNAIVCLLGPNRSGKSESILKGEGPFVVENTLLGKTGGMYLQGTGLLNSNLRSKIEKYFSEHQTEEKILLIDECWPSPSQIDVLNELLTWGYKIVVCRGGRVANEDKRTSWETLGKQNEFLQGMPVVEISTKPFNRVQMKEIGAFMISEEENNFVRKKDADIFQKRKMEVLWDLCISFFIENNVPCTYFIAKYIIKIIIAENGDSNSFFERMATDLYLTEPHNGDISVILFEYLNQNKQVLGGIVTLEELASTV